MAGFVGTRNHRGPANREVRSLVSKGHPTYDARIPGGQSAMRLRPDGLATSLGEANSNIQPFPSARRIEPAINLLASDRVIFIAHPPAQKYRQGGSIARRLAAWLDRDQFARGQNQIRFGECGEFAAARGHAHGVGRGVSNAKRVPDLSQHRHRAVGVLTMAVVLIEL